jgi:MerR family transcriptional regulator, repressor of the yfmOP operon
MTTARRARSGDRPVLWRIGEVAKLTGLTTRTLRYWDELDLLRPSSHGKNGARLYSPADLARVNRIRNLQDLLGFTLSEVGAVLESENIDVLDRVHSELAAGDITASRRRTLLEEAIAANDELLARLADTLSRIHAFRDERANIAIRLRETLSELDEHKSRRLTAGRR